MPGAIRSVDGSVTWNLWAPRAECVELVLSPEEKRSIHKMQRTEDWFSFRMQGIDDGVRYAFRMGELELPDPASRSQPDGVHRASAVFTPQSYQWRDHNWAGIAREDLVIYELHVGTFTSGGTFPEIVDRLPELKSLGITAIELMPVGQFPGERNWGYDGVFPFAVQNSYGGARALQHLVEAAHQSGLAVLLDVVYNHLGPEGNYLDQYGPYFTDAYRTPWGRAWNFDGPDSDPVRAFVLENVRMWIEDFHLDGLRLDAVHAIYDLSPRHLLSEIQETAQRIAAVQRRAVHVIAESDQNDPRLIDPLEQRGFGLSAVWADEFHHAIRNLLAGDRQGYFSEYGHLADLAKAYEEIFVFDGQFSPYRKRRHGAPVLDRDRSQFVVCIHNHDQIGNRAWGDRSATSLPPEVQRLACGLLCLSPCIPLIFMGEEYAEEHPFPFFCSFTDPSLIEAVRKGRREEFAALGFCWGEQLPDPQDEETFLSAKLCWKWNAQEFSGQLRRLFQDLFEARRSRLALRDREHTRATVLADSVEAREGLLLIERGEADSIVAVANLSPRASSFSSVSLQERTEILSTEDRCYGGRRSSGTSIDVLLPFELRIFGVSHG